MRRHSVANSATEHSALRITVLLASHAIRIFLRWGLDLRRALEEAKDSAQGRQTTTDQEEGAGVAKAIGVGGAGGNANDGPAQGSR